MGLPRNLQSKMKIPPDSDLKAEIMARANTTTTQCKTLLYPSNADDVYYLAKDKF
jgi:hypothetical protein